MSESHQNIGQMSSGAPDLLTGVCKYEESFSTSNPDTSILFSTICRFYLPGLATA